jgi:hypothetical protein
MHGDVIAAREHQVKSYSGDFRRSDRTRRHFRMRDPAWTSMRRMEASR